MIEFIALAEQCAPAIDRNIVLAIVKQESGFNPLAININKAPPIKQPKTLNEAVYQAKNLIEKGYSIDMGLGQINSANLKWLNLSVEQIFDPCINLSALKTIYQSCYNQATTTGYGTRIQRAFSCYNTGNRSYGFLNGYVNKVTRNLNGFLLQGNGINRKSSMTNMEDLAIYTPSSKVANPSQEDSINYSVENNQVVEKIDTGEKKQYSAWDAFNDF